MSKAALILFVGFLALGGVFIYKAFDKEEIDRLDTRVSPQSVNEGGPEVLQPHPLSIEALRNGDYPGSDFVIEQTLTPGSNYQRYIASYKSEGLKIFGLLTIPNGQVTEGGFPAIVFNHGYIPPAEYSTTEKYVPYVDGF